MQHQRARRLAEDEAADWVLRIGGFAWGDGGPGVAVCVAATPGARPRMIVRRADAGAAPGLELEAAIAGLEEIRLDAAMTMTPEVGWRVELRSFSEQLCEMIATYDVWSAPGREATCPGFAAQRPAFERMVDLIGDLQDMGAGVTVARIGHGARCAEDIRFAAHGQAALERHLARRAAAVVRPLFGDRRAVPVSARFFEIGVRAGLRAAPLPAGPARACLDRGRAEGARRRAI